MGFVHTRVCTRDRESYVLETRVSPRSSLDLSPFALAGDLVFPRAKR